MTSEFSSSKLLRVSESQGHKKGQVGGKKLVSVQGGHIHHYVSFMGLSWRHHSGERGQRQEVGQDRAEAMIAAVRASSLSLSLVFWGLWSITCTQGCLLTCGIQ